MDRGFFERCATVEIYGTQVRSSLDQQLCNRFLIAVSRRYASDSESNILRMSCR